MASRSKIQVDNEFGFKLVGKNIDDGLGWYIFKSVGRFKLDWLNENLDYSTKEFCKLYALTGLHLHF